MLIISVQTILLTSRTNKDFMRTVSPCVRIFPKTDETKKKGGRPWQSRKSRS